MTVDPKECLHPLCATVQIRIFLVASDFCCIWIPNFSLLENSFYEATKGGGQKPMVWREKERRKKEGL
jgi:hypothetical protein